MSGGGFWLSTKKNGQPAGSLKRWTAAWRVFGGSVNKHVKSDSTEPLDLAWQKIFAQFNEVFVNGDQAFPLNVTTEYWRIINQVASDKLDPKNAAGELQKFIASSK